MGSPVILSVPSVSIPRYGGLLAANVASVTIKSTLTAWIKKNLVIWDQRRQRKIHGVYGRHPSRKADPWMLPWTALDLQHPDLQIIPQLQLLHPPTKQKRTFQTGRDGCWRDKRRRRRRKKKRRKTETLVLSQGQHYIPPTLTSPMIQTPDSPVGDQPPIFDLPLTLT